MTRNEDRVLELMFLLVLIVVALASHHLWAYLK